MESHDTSTTTNGSFQNNSNKPSQMELDLTDSLKINNMSQGGMDYSGKEGGLAFKNENSGKSNYNAQELNVIKPGTVNIHEIQMGIKEIQFFQVKENANCIAGTKSDKKLYIDKQPFLSLFDFLNSKTEFPAKVKGKFLLFHNLQSGDSNLEVFERTNISAPLPDLDEIEKFLSEINGNIKVIFYFKLNTPKDEEQRIQTIINYYMLNRNKEFVLLYDASNISCYIKIEKYLDQQKMESLQKQNFLSCIKKFLLGVFFSAFETFIYDVSEIQECQYLFPHLNEEKIILMDEKFNFVKQDFPLNPETMIMRINTDVVKYIFLHNY
jgi:hypothetical protein